MMLDDLTDKQKQIVAAAQEKFKDLKDRTNPLDEEGLNLICLLYTSPSPRDMRRSRMPSSA